MTWSDPVNLHTFNFTIHQPYTPFLPHDRHQLLLSVCIHMTFQTYKNRPVIVILNSFCDRTARITERYVVCESVTMCNLRTGVRWPDVNFDTSSTGEENISVSTRRGLSPELVIEQVSIM